MPEPKQEDDRGSKKKPPAEEKIDETEVLGLVNKNLREEIILEFNGQMLSKFEYFSNFEKICVLITKLIREENLSKNETIFDVSQ